MKHLFIINPAAGSNNQTEEYREKIRKTCDPKGLDYRIEVSAAPGDCTRIAREAAQSGEDYRIFACGGDGTMNEIINGVVGYDNVAVTTFAGGSGNDFIRIFNDTAPFRDLERLLDCEEETFDLMHCNGDLSLNICSVGLDARVGTDIIKYKRRPLLHGHRAYVWSTVVNTIRGVAEHYVVNIAGHTFDEKFTLVCACNGRFYGGGFNPVPEADPADGLMDVLVIKKVSRLKLARVIGKYKKGGYKELPDVIRHFRTDSLEIRCDKPTSISLDGELRTAEVMQIGIAKEKIRFFYPKGLVWKKQPVCV